MSQEPKTVQHSPHENTPRTRSIKDDHDIKESSPSVDPGISTAEGSITGDIKWGSLLSQYAQESTMHGIRYISPVAKHTSRRVIWTALVVTGVTIFAYLMIDRLLHYYEFNKTISIDAEYMDKLPFPAVTICNQNIFRLSEVQNAGLYDTFKDKFSRKVDTTSTANGRHQESYPYLGSGCLSTDKIDRDSIKYVEVTLEGCQLLCRMLNNVQCSVIIHVHRHRTCILTQMAQLQHLLTPHHLLTEICNEAVVYRHVRDIDDSPIKCSYENDECPLIQDTDDDEDWIQVKATGDYISFDGQNIPFRDYTTYSDWGHIVQMITSNTRPGYQARLRTLFRQTDGFCLSLAHAMNEGGTLEIYLLSEDLNKHSLANFTGRDTAQCVNARGISSFWCEHKQPLPDGIHQIVLDGKRSINTSYSSFVLLDDIYIAKCSQLYCALRADLCFVIDSSGSIRDQNIPGQPDNWSLLLQFVVLVVNRFNIGQDIAHVGIVTFSNQATLKVPLDWYDQKSLENLIHGILYFGGNTNTSGGLRVMRQGCFSSSGDRHDVNNIAIVITDGISTRDIEQTIPEAQRAKDEGIQIFSLGITNQVDVYELRSISSGHQDEGINWFQTLDFSTLDDVLSQLVQEICLATSAQPVGPTKCMDGYDVIPNIASEGGQLEPNAKSVKECKDVCTGVKCHGFDLYNNTDCYLHLRSNFTLGRYVTQSVIQYVRRPCTVCNETYEEVLHTGSMGGQLVENNSTVESCQTACSGWNDTHCFGFDLNADMQCYLHLDPGFFKKRYIIPKSYYAPSFCSGCDGDELVSDAHLEGNCSAACKTWNSTHCFGPDLDEDIECYFNSNPEFFFRHYSSPVTQYVRKFCSGCSGNKFACSNGKCLPPERVCDGIKDCNDGTDEPGNCGQPSEPIWNGSLSEFYRKAGHQMKDLIYSCYFQGESCDGLLKTTLTDQGQCITFNPNLTNILHTKKTGSSFGLSLLLNTEQYEYIEGPRSDSGIKVYQHHQSEIPMVRDLGMAVQPGVHALMPIRFTQNKMLGKPHGNCGKAPLNLSGNVTYTYFHCQRECETDFIFQECHCIDAYMPGSSPGPYRMCTLEEYLNCVVEDIYQRGLRVLNCTCPEACHTTVFPSALSYATLSTLSVNNLLAKGQAHIKKAYLQHIELSQRIHAQNIGTLMGMFQKAKSNIEIFMRFITNHAKGKLEQVYLALEFLLERTVQQDLQMIQNMLLDDFDDFFENLFTEIIPFLDETESRVNWINWTLTEINVEYKALDLLELLQTANVTLIHILNQLDALRQQDNNIAKYQDSNIGRVFSWNIESTTVSSCENVRKRVIADLDQFVYKLSPYSNISISFDAMKSNLSIFLLEFNILKKCIKRYPDVMLSARDVLSASKMELLSTSQSIKSTKKQIQGSVYNLSFVEEIKEMEKITKSLESMLNQYATNETTIGSLTEQFKHRIENQVHNTMTSTRSKMTQGFIIPAHNALVTIKSQVMEWYETLVDETIKVALYQPDMSFTVCMLNISSWPEFDPYMTSIRFTYISEKHSQCKQNDVDTQILHEYLNPVYISLVKLEVDMQHEQNNITEAIIALENHLSNRVMQSQIDDKFIRNNFLQLDIYYPVLRQENVTHRKAYTAENYLSEVGGYMGLLIGASCVTIFEILDLILYNFLLKCGKDTFDTPGDLYK